MSEKPQSNSQKSSETKPKGSKAAFSFGIFTIFFIYYMGTAILQTPPFKDIASIPLFGMPAGLFLSLMVFPVSWILIFVYFRGGR